MKKSCPGLSVVYRLSQPEGVNFLFNMKFITLQVLCDKYAKESKENL